MSPPPRGRARVGNLSFPHPLPAATEGRRGEMQVVCERCCGLDVHKKTVVACALLTQADGSVQRRVRTFGTMTAALLALSDWLAGLDIRQIALESTGV